MECFEECAHHVATGVPKEDWAEWATLLSTSEECGDGAVASEVVGAGGQHEVSPMHRNRLDKLACVDEVRRKKLGDQMISCYSSNTLRKSRLVTSDVLFFNHYSGV